MGEHISKDKENENKQSGEAEGLTNTAKAPAFSLTAGPIQRQSVEGEAEAVASDPVVTFGANANSAAVAAGPLAVIKRILTAAGESSCTITSTARTPADQARAMYDNIVAHGVEHQKALYGRYGDMIIDAYVTSEAAGNDATQIKADMEAKIIEVGPSNVSKHCADSSVLCVVDIAPSSIGNDTKFREAVVAETAVSNHIFPPTDPAYHLEIPV